MKIDDIYSLFSRSSGISTDTRTIKSKNLFFCLKGKNFNGNLFIDQAISLGASFVIYDEEKLNHKSKRAFKVKNALETLGMVILSQLVYLLVKLVLMTKMQVTEDQSQLKCMMRRLILM